MAKSPRSVRQSDAVSRSLKDRANVLFTDLFTETSEGEFRVSQKQVRRVLANPCSKQIEGFNGLQLGFFAAEEGRADNARIVLVCARIVNDEWAVDLAFPLRRELADDIRTIEPLALLRRLVESFGCEIRIGAHRGKFIFRESIPIDPSRGDLLKLVEVLEPRDQGLLYPIISLDQRGSDTFVNCALAFCINTGKYVSWLSDWDHNPAPSVKPHALGRARRQGAFRLTTHEKKEVQRFAKRMSPDDLVVRDEAAKYRGACVLLKKVLGEDWYRNSITPRRGAGNTFLRRSIADPLELNLQVVRAIELAEALCSLRAVPGITERVRDVEGKTLESLWFEYFVPYLIQQSGNRVVEFVPESLEEKRPDLIVEFRGQLIPVEVKAKEEDAVYSRRNLLNLLNKGFGQLPKSGPGAIFLMVPTRWLQNEKFLQHAEQTITNALRRHPNCNVVFVFWPLNTQRSTGELIYQWRFRPFATWHPMCSVPKITGLVAKRVNEAEPPATTFLE